MFVRSEQEEPIGQVWQCLCRARPKAKDGQVAPSEACSSGAGAAPYEQQITSFVARKRPLE